MTTLWTVLAGVAGCLLRWLIEEVVERRDLSHRPVATMAVNAVGCFLAGTFVFGALHATGGPATHGAVTYGTSGLRRAAPFLLTGFCGGFTTFSSAIAIPYLHATDGHRRLGVALLVTTPLLCAVGYWLGELFTHPLLHVLG